LEKNHLRQKLKLRTSNSEHFLKSQFSLEKWTENQAILSLARDKRKESEGGARFFLRLGLSHDLE